MLLCEYLRAYLKKNKVYERSLLVKEFQNGV